MRSQILTSKSDGFSLMELIIAMAITLTVMTIASTLLARGFNVRTRENQKSDALADAQRALNIMSREIANAGFNIDVASGSNGIVTADSGPNSIRFCSNLNKFDLDPALSAQSRDEVRDPGEDILYTINAVDDTTYLARHDRFADTPLKQKTVLANRIDAFNLHYFDRRVTYTTGDTDIANASAAEVAPGNATYVVISLAVTLDQVGTPGSPGYQPPFRVLLVSDVALRNHDLTTY